MHRTTPIVLALTALCTLPAYGQLPPSVELRVPKAPTVATSDAGQFIAYELHMTNLTPATLNIDRVEVLDAAGAILTAVADSTLLRSVWRPGRPVPAAERTSLDGGLGAVVYVWLPLEGHPPEAISHRVVFARDTIEHGIVGARTMVHAAEDPIGPPLRGEWAALNGPSNTSGHRRLVLGLNGNLASGQRFAIDYVQVDGNGSTNTGDATKNDTHHAYGEDILAVADGMVVDTKDGIPENVPGVQSRAVPIDLETVAGNYVVIDIGGGRFAFYAHLIPGSMRVAVGDRVKRGQVIGLVGNSGNSTEPHLHFHLVDGIAKGTATLGAEGIPYGIDRLELVGGCTLDQTGINCAHNTPVVVRGGIPLQNQIVRFPE